MLSQPDGDNMYSNLNYSIRPASDRSFRTRIGMYIVRKDWNVLRDEFTSQSALENRVNSVAEKLAWQVDIQVSILEVKRQRLNYSSFSVIITYCCFCCWSVSWSRLHERNQHRVRKTWQDFYWVQNTRVTLRIQKVRYRWRWRWWSRSCVSSGEL